MQYARESTLTISRCGRMDRLGSRRFITSLERCFFYEHWSRNSIGKTAVVVVHRRFYLRDERTSPVRKFKMPIAKTNATRRARWVPRSTRDPTRYRCELEIARPSAIESLTYLHNVLIIKKMYKASEYSVNMYIQIMISIVILLCFSLSEKSVICHLSHMCVVWFFFFKYRSYNVFFYTKKTLNYITSIKNWIVYNRSIVTSRQHFYSRFAIDATNDGVRIGAKTINDPEMDNQDNLNSFLCSVSIRMAKERTAHAYRDSRDLTRSSWRELRKLLFL